MRGKRGTSTSNDKQKEITALSSSHTFHSLSAALLVLFLGLATAPSGSTLLV
jgi:hypothetical protein